jgi:GNAT superfamily N-acetyltransferase
MNRRFTEPVDTYTVLILNFDDYRGTSRELPNGFRFIDEPTRAMMRAQEKKILQQLFEDWDIPFFGKLRGWRADSPIFVAYNNRLIGGVYLCAQNEFDVDPARGQLHYAFMDLEFQGLGIYSVIFREAVERAQHWGLRALFLNSDRYLLPEVYLRWGAQAWRTIVKPSRLPQNELGHALRIIYAPLRRLRWYLRRRFV